jgi:hypothetical protein
MEEAGLPHLEGLAAFFFLVGADALVAHEDGLEGAQRLLHARDLDLDLGDLLVLEPFREADAVGEGPADVDLQVPVVAGTRAAAAGARRRRQGKRGQAKR